MHRLSGTETEVEDQFDALVSLKALEEDREEIISVDGTKPGSCYHRSKSQVK